MLRIELSGAKFPTGFSFEVDEPRRPRDGSDEAALEGAFGACSETIWFDAGCRSLTLNGL